MGQIWVIRKWRNNIKSHPAFGACMLQQFYYGVCCPFLAVVGGGGGREGPHTSINLNIILYARAFISQASAACVKNLLSTRARRYSFFKFSFLLIVFFNKFDTYYNKIKFLI